MGIDRETVLMGLFGFCTVFGTGMFVSGSRFVEVETTEHLLGGILLAVAVGTLVLSKAGSPDTA
jgi:hypothetical protein